MSAVARTPSGALTGRQLEGCIAFQGVPYARPPTGAMRFAAPEPAPPWPGERDALAFSPAQPQTPDPLVERLGLAPKGSLDEDCLYLNVWTPAVDDARRPVLVWVPGGAFVGGTACTDLYDGARMAARGDVVVVTVNYRVGTLGFGCFPGLPANLGLRDQITALAWVRDSIQAFGGDPTLVTVFGESAGAGSLVSLLAAPEARPLFGRAIVQSAAPGGMIDRTEAERRGGLILARLGIGPGDVDALRAAPVGDLLRAQKECFEQDGPFDYNMLFLPVIDGEVLPRRPTEAIAAGEARDTELMIGTTEDELGLYAESFAGVTDAVLPLALAASAPEVDADRVIATYREARAARSVSVSAPDLFVAIQSDRTMRVPSARLAAGHAVHQPRTFSYLFSWRSPMKDGLYGSCHALDLPFTFGNLDVPGMAEFAGKGPQVRELSNRLMDAWIAFARTGNPGHPGIGDWPAYTAASRDTMELGARCGARPAPLEAERAAWDTEPTPPLQASGPAKSAGTRA